MRPARTFGEGAAAHQCRGAGRSLGCCGMSDGELLIGDGVTQGIVRIGDTVRRPLRPCAEAWLREAAPAITARLGTPG